MKLRGFRNRNGKKQREEHYKNGVLDGLPHTSSVLLCEPLLPP
jgi:hypothetical protein